MVNGIKVFFIVTLIGFFQTVPKDGFSKEATFKILDGESIGFTYQVALIDFKGQFVVDTSNFQIDFERPEASMFQLYFDVNQSTAGFPLATKLMRSEAVLSSKKNPRISFISEKIMLLNNCFRIMGMLTIKGISKKIELIAKIDMKNTNRVESASLLHFNISANILRSDYGAGGYSGLVGDKIVLDSKITVSRLQ